MSSCSPPPSNALTMRKQVGRETPNRAAACARLASSTRDQPDHLVADLEQVAGIEEVAGGEHRVADPFRRPG